MRIFLLVIALFSISLYGPLNRRHARYYWSSALDKRVPFHPGFVIPYISLFPFVALAFVLLFPHPIADVFYLSMTICALSAAVFWYFFPTGFRRPRNIRDVGVRHMLREIYRYDRSCNAFPSSHVYLSVISGFFLAIAFPLFSIPIWIVTVLIAVSTVFVRQHELLDIAGGLLWAAVSIALAFAILA